MKNECNVISVCEVCGNEEPISVLNLGLHPMCDDLIKVGDSGICKEYPIEILFCRKCYTAHQRFQVPKQELFPASYHYRARFTADVLKGMSGLVESCKEIFGDLSDKKVLDIGCNDGSLLDIFKKEGAKTFGLEPTGACADAMGRGHVTFNEYLSEDAAEKIIKAHGAPDFITFTNVFAHIENLDEVLSSLKILMASNTVVIIENHYLGAIFNGNQFDTFYHEHPRTYSYRSFTNIARSLGVELLDVEFPSRYGGNIRVFMGDASLLGTRGSVDIEELNAKEDRFFENFAVLRKNMESWRALKKMYLLSQFNQYGKLRAKAFPGRAAILIKLLGLNHEYVSAVYEKPGSLKIGNYLPGTRIPICSDHELFEMKDKSIPLINLAWHIPLEIRDYLKKNGYSGEVIDIISPNDFLEAQI